MELKAYLKQRAALVERNLDRYLPGQEAGPEILAAMRYSLFAGGKRVRPVLCLAAAEAVGGSVDDAMFCACALEMVHSYSLVHDDLPAMDDDDLRRGKPTNHKVFGEGMAVLAGDGLLTEAMVLLTGPHRPAGLDPDRVLRAAQVVMAASGWQGMVGGQAADLLGEQMEPDLATVQFIHAHKTGALLTASVVSGAILGGGGEDDIERFRRYGHRVGLAFQIADDLLNLEGDPEKLGKAVGSDADHGKMTYPAVMGVSAAREEGWKMAREAADIAREYGKPGLPLSELALYIMSRTH